jgi:acyl-CoA synthetase (AMP-forming)/AMP-acid ligase II/thioesterase domain-containing protein/acyl carrier protein
MTSGTSMAAAFDARLAEPGSIAGLLLRAARLHPHSGIHCVEQGSERFVSYPQLLEEALVILSGLRARGCVPGSNIALLLGQSTDFLACFWACVLGGFAPCPLAPIRNDQERWLQHLAHINTLFDRPVLITTPDFMRDMADIDAVELTTLRAAAPEAGVHEAQPSDVALFMLTSGSTGNCKAVALTHANLLASLPGKNEFQQLGGSDVALNWIALDHVASVIETHLLPLFAGASQVHASPDLILAEPLNFLRFIDRYRVTMTFAPNFLFGKINAALQTRGAQLSLDLSCLRHIVSGGEAVVVETGRQFLELLAPFGLKSSVLWPAFGMTECCAGSVYSRAFPPEDRGQEFASLGSAIPGMEMRIVDARNHPVRPGEPGELQLRGPMVFAGYYNNEEATRAAFTADGWFRTGDLGRLERGELLLVGRSKDSIIISGANYFSHELENVLGQLDGIERSLVAAFPTRPKGADTEQLVVTFAPAFSMEDGTRLYQLMIAIRNTAVLLWGFRPALMLPLPAEAFPKTSLGKIPRALLRKRLESGEFSAAQERAAQVLSQHSGEYVAPRDALESEIAGIFASIFDVETNAIGATANFFDLGGTSLDIVKLKLAIEAHFNFDLPIATLLQNPTVQALALRLACETRLALNDYDPVVPLQTSGKKTPLFCVHAGSGEVLVFLSLAGYFVNERPFYALRARGFEPGQPYFGSFDEMIDIYTAAVRRRQPHGPYALAGYSYGAPVAFEIAKRLEAQGEQVAFVGSIDGTPTIGDTMKRLDLIDSAVVLAFFLSLIDRRQMAQLPAQLRASGEDACAYIFDHAPPERLTDLDLTLQRFREWTQLSHSLVGIGESYVPLGTVESLSVFYASPMSGTKREWLHQLRRWDEFARAAARYIEVDGEHHTLFTPQYVTTLQTALRAEIDRSLGGR